MNNFLKSDHVLGALVRTVVFFGIIQLFGIAWQHFLKHLGLTDPTDFSNSVLRLLPFAILNTGPLAASIALTLIFGRFDKHTPSFYGLPFTAVALRRLAQGALTAVASFSLVIGSIAAFGGYVIHGWAQHGLQALGYALGWAGLFAMVALHEELVFRGYALTTLARPLGFWSASIFTSGYFAYGHAGNSFEDWQTLIMLALFAMSGCIVRYVTGSLWFLVGFHMFWDYVESTVYSVPDSGLSTVGHLLDASLRGNATISGGNVGPEASPITILIDLLVLTVIVFLFRKKRAETPAPAFDNNR